MEQGADYVDIELQVFMIAPSRAVPVVSWLHRNFLHKLWISMRGQQWYRICCIHDDATPSTMSK